MRCALFGLGHSAETILLPAARALTHLEVVAACDPEPAARERGARLGIPRSFERAEDLLDAVRPELVLIATPPDSHRQLSELALQAGAHVFCEKPFVPSVSDADAVLEAAAQAGRQVAVNNQYYRMPVFAKLRDRLESPSVGRLVCLQLWQTTMEPESRHTGWTGRLRRRTLFEFGNHAVHLVRFLFGEDPEAVTCMTGRDAAERPWDAVVSVAMQFSRERLATIVADRISRGRWRYLDLRAEAERVTLRASLGGEARWVAGIDGLARVPFFSTRFTWGGLAWTETGERRRTFAKNPRGAYMLATRRHLEGFLDAIRTGRPYAQGAHQSRGVIEAVAAAYLSAELGRRVDLAADREAVAKVVMA